MRFFRTFSFSIPSTLMAFSTITSACSNHTNSISNADRASVKTNESSRLLPDENCDWKCIRLNNFVYIDKTPYLRKLLESFPAPRILTRPRGFGKSTFLKMAYEFFRGNKDLFEGLSIEKDGNVKFFENYSTGFANAAEKWVTLPAIYLNFSICANFTTKRQFQSCYQDIMLAEIAKDYEIYDFMPDSETAGLIGRIYLKCGKLRVIVLVDDYDHPYQYALSIDPELAKQMKILLDGIFTQMKNDVERIQLVFATGVSRLNFVGADNFVDLTYEKDFAAAFGFTEEEIDDNLRDHVNDFCLKSSKSYDSIIGSLKEWYGGYQFDNNNGACWVLNPVSTILSLKKQKFDYYWINDASLNYVVENLYELNFWFDYFDRGASIFESSLRTALDFYAFEPNLKTWMLWNGYFTISNDGKKSKIINLRTPNKEIRTAIENALKQRDSITKKNASCK